MRLAIFEFRGQQRMGLALKERAGEICDLTSVFSRFELNQPGLAGPPGDMLTLVRTWSELAESLQQVASDPSVQTFWLDQTDVKLRAPLERPGKIVCLAGNYREHIVESGYVAPAESDLITQQLFLKPATALIGDGDEIAISPNNVTVGWETELAVVIGKTGRDIPAAEALEHVFGYTILNDISERGLNSQFENRKKRELDGFFDWLAGKWFDGFAPCGPWIVTADEIAVPHNLNIKLRVNGDIKQEGNTCDMIFRIPEQIAYISSIMTLEPGDIISTGTPVGAGIGGKASLKVGDEMVCEIEKVGVLKNRVVSRKSEVS